MVWQFIMTPTQYLKVPCGYTDRYNMTTAYGWIYLSINASLSVSITSGRLLFMQPVHQPVLSFGRGKLGTISAIALDESRYKEPQQLIARTHRAAVHWQATGRQGYLPPCYSRDSTQRRKDLPVHLPQTPGTGRTMIAFRCNGKARHDAILWTSISLNELYGTSNLTWLCYSHFFSVKYDDFTQTTVPLHVYKPDLQYFFTE